MHRLIVKNDSGFSMLELLLVLAVTLLIVAMAVPQAYTAIKAYRLHSDAAAISSQMNVVRMKAASQYAPYRLVINVAAGTYWQEKLCGLTTSSTDAACTSAYQAFTTPQIEGGAQYAVQGDTFSSCRPSSITGSAYPGTIQGNLSPCPDPLYIYFNTRGAPVDNTGSPLGNGGAVVYLKNQNNMIDAVTVATGGAVTLWNWDTASSTWIKR